MLLRTLFVQGRCDVLEQDRTVESSTPYVYRNVIIAQWTVTKKRFFGAGNIRQNQGYHNVVKQLNIECRRLRHIEY